MDIKVTNLKTVISLIGIVSVLISCSTDKLLFNYCVTSYQEANLEINLLFKYDEFEVKRWNNYYSSMIDKKYFDTILFKDIDSSLNTKSSSLIFAIRELNARLIKKEDRIIYIYYSYPDIFIYYDPLGQVKNEEPYICIENSVYYCDKSIKNKNRLNRYLKNYSQHSSRLIPN